MPDFTGWRASITGTADATVIWDMCRRKNGDFVIRIGEHMVDLSRTTAYRICVSKAFCRKNRYGGMVVYADGMQKYLIIEGDDMRF